MPIVVNYPGVYIEELPSSSHTVGGVTTASTAFVDYFTRGPMNQAVRITNFRDFQRTFGGLHRESEASYGLMQYFNNGGSTAWVVRVGDTKNNVAKTASLTAEVKTPSLADTVQVAIDAAQKAQIAAESAAKSAQELSPEVSSTLQVDQAVNATRTAAEQTQKASNGAKGAPAADIKAASTAAAKASAAADQAQKAIEAVFAASDQDALKDLSKKASDAGTAAAKAAATAAAAAKKVAGGASDDTKEAANAAATAADDAAKKADTAAKTAVQTLSDAPAPDKPDSTQKAENVALKLAQDVDGIADQTQDAAAATKDAAHAADQASKELEIAVQIAEAAGGAYAAEAKAAALGAAEAAEEAGRAAQEAAEAAEAAGKVDPNDAEASHGAIQAAVQAADDAAKAAADAAGKAGEAQVAAEVVQDAAEAVRLVISGANPGVWSNNIQVKIINQPHVKGRPPTFDLYASEVKVIRGVTKAVSNESYHNINLDPASSRYGVTVINNASDLIQVDYLGEKLDGAFPVNVGSEVEGVNLRGGTDGGKANAAQLTAGMEQGLNNIAPNVFNILCLPAVADYSAGEASAAYSAALKFCEEHRAFLVMDVPQSVQKVEQVKSWSAPFRNADNYNGAIYFPRLVMPDPLQEYRPRNVAASGTIAGIYAQTDQRRGVWKAPAGIEAAIQGAEIAVKLRDADSAVLNPLGINVLRSFPVYGNIVWGARTLAGADQMDSQYKYVNVRRLTDYIEESLFQSLKWVVFENNDERTWGQIRLQVGSFMASLFAEGAFQGKTPDQGYLVACDSTTTTPSDVDLGICNIIVGFAAEKPAEFVILQIEQLVGQG